MGTRRYIHIDGLVQERHNSNALALELRLSFTNPSIYYIMKCITGIVHKQYIFKDMKEWFTPIGYFHLHWKRPRWYGIATLSVIDIFHSLREATKVWQAIFLNICKDSIDVVEMKLGSSNPLFTAVHLDKLSVIAAVKFSFILWWKIKLTMQNVINDKSHECCMYRQVSNIGCTLVGNKIVDHSDVVGASPVDAAPTTSSFST